ncbi:alpha/beta fold hydrolase [Sandaracinus amylolyticus]|uniref:alpha/beta fold hydrolase n=1 Tax=Sandaracinus amylolyticus TaxID=927083 RepID=UPI001F21896C|nr:alpha/beta hydrolase [Sandaracinus amylolyticus]UJR82099.1 Pimeloyl-ACP methyl ester carboxylesterase [Sandaracinus amylolyticus]
MTTTHTLPVRGGRLHYEVRGEGPVLLVMGSPMDAVMFGPLADALARDHTVVTHDPPGISRSTFDDPQLESTPELRADCVVAILDALGAKTADLFGSSGGAVTGLALVTRHPGRLRTLVAHEPPLLELLPDAAQLRAMTEENIAIYQRHGVGAAWMQFMKNAGFDVSEHAGPPGEPTEKDLRNSARFFLHELRGTTRYLPDIAALRASETRVVVGLGETSGHLLTSRTSIALAERLGTKPTMFPGDHGGFMGQPNEFADTLRQVLAR